MKHRIIIGAILIVIGYFVSGFLMQEIGDDSFSPVYILLLRWSAILLPPLFYILLGRMGLLYGALLALAYNFLDVVFLKHWLFGDELPQTLVNIPNIFGIGPINGFYLVIAIVVLLLTRRRK